MFKSIKSKFITCFFAILSLALALVLAAACCVIVKLNRNNMFSKSIMLDNNYFIDYENSKRTDL